MANFLDLFNTSTQGFVISYERTENNILGSKLVVDFGDKKYINKKKIPTEVSQVYNSLLMVIVDTMITKENIQKKKKKTSVFTST